MLMIGGSQQPKQIKVDQIDIVSVATWRPMARLEMPVREYELKQVQAAASTPGLAFSRWRGRAYREGVFS